MKTSISLREFEKWWLNWAQWGPDIFGLHILFPPANEVYRKIMFLLMSICLFTGGGLMWPLGMALSLRHWSQEPHSPLDMEPETPLVVTSGDIIIGDLFRLVRCVHFWTPLQHLVVIEAHAVCASGWYASYWNAFLCSFIFISFINYFRLFHPSKKSVNCLNEPFVSSNTMKAYYLNITL